MAQNKVNKSPKLNSEPFGLVISPSPLRAKITPIKEKIFGFSLTKRTDKGGTIITKSPVINADLEEAVYFNPTVWNAKPKNKKIPIIIPALRVPLSIREIFFE
jgi:hypothetical protein